jgi:ribosome maturation factor RimP
MKSSLTPTQEARLCKTVLNVAIDALAQTPFVPLAVELDYAMGRLILQVFLEKKDIRITLDECAEASQLLEPLIDELAELQAHSYVLEVSSPGLFRHLSSLRELRFYIGKTVTLKPLDVPESKATVGTFSPYQLMSAEETASGIEIGLKSQAGETKTHHLNDLPEGHGICLAPPIQWPNDETEAETDESL